LKKIFLTAAIAVTACTTAPPPLPVVTPQGEDRYLVDPRLGYTATVPPNVDRQFAAIWSAIESGQLAFARQQLVNLHAKNPGYLPADLAEAAIELRESSPATARSAVKRVQDRAQQPYLAADIYEAEIAAREGNIQQAWDVYSRLSAQADLPEVTKQRIGIIQQKLIDELVTSARTAADPEAVSLLERALAINPSVRDIRMQLVQRLLTMKEWDQARAALDPLLSSEPDQIDVQQSLAEIEIGRGQFEQAIVRYERLARRDSRYAQRLEQVKEQWNAANMPPQFQRAAETEELTRADFAVLLYWKVASIRFAQNLGTPPIAVDIGDIPGREEIIRAIALGILQVDPVTRRVNPSITVNAVALSRYAARTLTARGAVCARGTNDPSKILAQCGVSDPSATLPPESPVSGRIAEQLIDEIDRVLSK